MMLMLEKPLEFHEDDNFDKGFQSELPSPLNYPNYYDDDDDEGNQGEEYVKDENEENAKKLSDQRISTELIQLLQQQTKTRQGAMPGFLASQLQSKTKLSLRERLFRWFARLSSRENDITEPLFPLGMFNKPKADEELKPIPTIKATSRDPLLHKSKSLELLRQTSQPELPITLDFEDLMHEKYRQCLRNAKTMISLSYAQLKECYSKTQLPIEPETMASSNINIKKGRLDEKACFLLPLNEVGKARLIGHRKLNIGRGDDNMFAHQSRVISRHQCQIFWNLNQAYIYDVGSNSGTFINGERLSNSGQISPTRKLEHLDILQLGVDYVSGREAGVDQLEPQYRAPQFLVILGYAKPQDNNKDDQRRGRRRSSNSSPIAMKPSKLQKMLSRAKIVNFPISNGNSGDNEETKLGAFRMYFELGSLLGESASGWAVFTSNELDQYTMVFNNFQLSWIIGMTELKAESSNTWILENSKGTYRIMKDGRRMAKLAEADNKTFLIPRGNKSPSRKEGRPELKIVPPPSFLICGSKTASPVSLPSPTLSLACELEQDKEERYYYSMSGNVKSGLQVTARFPERPSIIVSEIAIIREERGKWGKKKLWVNGRLLLHEELRAEQPLLSMALALKVLNTQQQ